MKTLNDLCLIFINSLLLVICRIRLTELHVLRDFFSHHHLISVYKKAFEWQSHLSSFAICSALHPSNSHFIILDFYNLKADSFFGPFS